MLTKTCSIKMPNCLNLIRLLAAFKVMYGHFRVHLDVALPSLLTQIIEFISGVPVFFVMSGFLIWNSAGNARNFWEYGKKRFFRIFPELWLGVAIEILTILFFYLENIDPIELGLFAFGQATVFQFWTPDSLRGYGCGTPNGSLWTICVLIQFYVAVWFLYKQLHGKAGKRWGIAYLVALFVSTIPFYMQNAVPVIVYKLYSQTLLPYLWLFLLGAFVAEFSDKLLPFLKKYWWAFLLSSITTTFLQLSIFGVQQYDIIKSVALALGLLGFAYHYPGLNIKLDVTYGLYIYHMIVANVMISLGQVGNVGVFVISIGVSMLLAYGCTIFGKTINRLAQRNSASEVKS